MATYEFYAYFDATQVQGVINAIVSLMGSSGPDGNYGDLLRLAGVMGLMMAIALGYARSRGEDAAHYMIMLALWYSMLFTPRVPLTIIPVGPAVGAPVVVSNVPIGLAFFASATSKIGHWFTDNAETFFSLPDPTQNFSQHGLMGSTRTLRVANSASLQNPVLVQSMTNFMRDCINPELVAAPAALTSLIQSKSIWADLANLGLINPGRVVSIPTDPTPQDCGTAYTGLGAQLTASATSEFGRIAKLLSPYAPPASANTILASMLPASEGLIMTASASTSDAIKQRMMINLLNNTSRTMGQILNDPAAISNALAVSIAQQSTLSSYQVMAKLAQETLPIIRNTLELVIIGVFPIILVVIILSGTRGGLVLKGYVMMLLWVQLWAPLYAIVNYVATLSGANSLTSALNGIDGLAIANAAALSEGTISAEAVAGLLTIAVPIIALALVKGGEVAATSAAGTLMGPSTKAGEAAAASVASGNVSLGNVSWGNYTGNNDSANKSDISASHVAPGNYKEVMSNGATVTQNGQGAVVDYALPMQTRAESGVGRSSDLGNTRGSERGANWKDGTFAGWETGTSTSLSREGAMQWIARAGEDINRQFGTNVDWAKLVGQQKALQGDRGTSVVAGESDRRALQTYADIGIKPPSGSSGVVPTTGSTASPPAVPAGATDPGSASQNGAGTSAAPSPGTSNPGTQGGTSTPSPSRMQNALTSIGNMARYLPVGMGERETHEQDSTTGSGAKSSENTSESTRVSADNVVSAIQQLKATLGNGQERAAADRLATAFRRETSTSHGRRAETADYGGASSRNEEREVAESHGSFTSGRPALDLAMKENGQNYRYAMDFLTRGSFSGEFVRGLSDTAKGGRPDGDLAPPVSPATVKVDGSQHEGETNSQGQGEVRKDGQGHRAEVMKAQGQEALDPRKQTDLAPVAVAYGAVAGEAGELFAIREREGQVHRGETMAAAQLHKAMHEPGMLSIWKGKSYDPPNAQQSVQVVQALAESSPSFKAELEKSGAGGQLTPAARAYIEQEGPKQWDAQRVPTRLDNAKEAVRGAVRTVEGLMKADE